MHPLTLFTLSLISIPSLIRAVPCPPDAGGAAPTIAYPVSAETVTELQNALFLEHLEAAFFRQAADNLTSWGPQSVDNRTLLAFQKIAAQEAVHVTTIEHLLASSHQEPVSPCEYNFPSKNVSDLVKLGETLAAVGVSFVIGLSDRLAKSDPQLSNAVASILSVEARHDTFLRLAQRKEANPSPFDTSISARWALNLALPFVVPQSCPKETFIEVLPTLTLQNALNSTDAGTRVTLAWQELTLDELTNQPLSVAWTNQLQPPVYSALNITGMRVGETEIPLALTGETYVVLTVEQPGSAHLLERVAVTRPLVLDVCKT